MIDHMSVHVSDLIRARDFYLAALAPLGYAVLHTFPASGDPIVLGLGIDGKPDLWLVQGQAAHAQHIALRSSTRKLVAAFHAAAVAAGGRDNGAPGVRAHYHASYYGAFVLDPDGHNLELCCHEPYIE